jgi:hypothetical protein
LEENSSAVEVKLTKDEVEKVRKLVESAEVHGARYIFPLVPLLIFRYPEQMQAHLYADTPEKK